MSKVTRKKTFRSEKRKEQEKDIPFESTYEEIPIQRDII